MKGTFLLLFSNVIQINLCSKRFQSSYSFFALVLTFSTNSRGKACYAGYIQISDKIKQKYSKNERNSDRLENLKRFLFLHQKFTFIETRSSLNFRRLLRGVVYLNFVLSRVQIKWDMFGKIYPQSAAHITTIHGCFTILQFTDPRSLALDPRSPFPISDSPSRLSSPFPVSNVYSIRSMPRRLVFGA